MRIAFLVLPLCSFLVLPACSRLSTTITNSDAGLPSLFEHKQHLIIQVASNFDTGQGIQRDHPFFIICYGDDCQSPTTKTPIDYTPGVPKVAHQTATGYPAMAVKKGFNIDGKNPTYLKKSSRILEQFRVHFDYASAVVTDTFNALLDEFVHDYPHKRQRIRVTGYTDSDSKPDGKIGNEWLALERATNVKHRLIALGYPESQVLLEAKFLCCYIDSNENAVGQRNNRRAEISLIINEYKE